MKNVTLWNLVEFEQEKKNLVMQGLVFDSEFVNDDIVSFLQTAGLLNSSSDVEDYVFFWEEDSIEMYSKKSGNGSLVYRLEKVA